MSSEHKDIGTIVTFIVALVLLVWMLTACCPCRHLATSTQDSVRAEVVERLVEVRDTAYIEIPSDKQNNVVRDTASLLMNAYAISRAVVDAGGYLHHSLQTIPQRVAQPRTIFVPMTDTTRTRVVHRTEVVEVERGLTWWQQTQIGGFWALAALLAVLVLWRRLKAKMGLY
jgi:hypothetical protein